jgi:SHS2 domain-containing protein
LSLQGFTFVDHTADLAAKLEAPTLDALFAAAAGALTSALTLPERVKPRVTQTIQLDAGDLELLLVDWAAELLYRFDAEGFLVADARVHVEQAAGRWRLDAEVSGETRDPARHPIKVLVKAVTFHGLKIERREGRYVTLLIFDI